MGTPNQSGNATPNTDTGLVETHRGNVAAWECDVFGHLNIAFYVDRFADAAADLLERRAPRQRWRTLALDVRYLRELRAGDGCVIRSAILEADAATVTVAHELIDGTTGERSTLAEHRLAGAAAPAVTSLAWERFPAMAWPTGEGRIAAGRDRAKPGDIEDGHLSLLGCLHRFSNACLHVVEAFGMTAAYRRDARRGFATFETRLVIDDSAAVAGDGLVARSDVVAVGNSSLRMLHRLTAARDGRQLARFMQAGVHFDLDARRAAPWPETMRHRAAALRLAEK
jgi:acyl-CoA thioesterase FadM